MTLLPQPSLESHEPCTLSIPSYGQRQQLSQGCGARPHTQVGMATHGPLLSYRIRGTIQWAFALRFASSCVVNAGKL